MTEYNVLIPFGKYKGLSLGYVRDTNPSYLRWLAHEDAMPATWREAAMCVLHKKTIDHLGLQAAEFTQGHPTAQVWCLNKTTLAVKFDYDKELLSRFKVEIDGRVWNRDENRWEFPAVHIVSLVRLFGGTRNIQADESTKAIYREEVQRRKELDVIRDKETTTLDVKTKLPLFNYQRVAVEFILRANGRALVADPVGLGKTAVAIGYAVHTGHKTLVVCNKSVVPNWILEIERFAGKKAVRWESEGPSSKREAQFHVINYDIVYKHIKELNKLGLQFLVCDEATFLKNRNTKRAKSVLGSWKERKTYPGIKTKDCVFLTGTPILNKPVEAYHLLNYLDKNRFNNFMHFVQRYGGWRGDEPRNFDELHHRTKDLIIRRSRSAVKSEIPALMRNDLVVNMEPNDIAEYNKHLEDLFKQWKKVGNPSAAQMPAIQKFLITKKMPRLVEVIDELLEADRGVLVFSTYIAPLKFLKQKYGDLARTVLGEMSSKDRQQSIVDLSSGTAKVGLFTIGAGSMGIDGLQRSIDTVIFLDQWWVPAIHEQAEARIYRTGQTMPVQAYYMICEKTVDEYMREILAEKQKMIDQIVDGRLIDVARSRSFFKEFVHKLQAEYKLTLNPPAEALPDLD